MRSNPWIASEAVRKFKLDKGRSGAEYVSTVYTPYHIRLNPPSTLVPHYHSYYPYYRRTCTHPPTAQTHTPDNRSTMFTTLIAFALAFIALPSLCRVTDVYAPSTAVAGENITVVLGSEGYIQNWNDFGVSQSAQHLSSSNSPSVLNAFISLGCST